MFHGCQGRRPDTQTYLTSSVPEPHPGASAELCEVLAAVLDTSIAELLLGGFEGLLAALLGTDHLEHVHGSHQQSVRPRCMANTDCSLSAQRVLILVAIDTVCPYTVLVYRPEPLR